MSAIRISVGEYSQVFVRAPPPANCNKPIHKVQLDIDDALVGNVPEPGMAVQDVHVLLNLGFGNQPHFISAHAVVLQLHAPITCRQRHACCQQHLEVDAGSEPNG